MGSVRRLLGGAVVCLAVLGSGAVAYGDEALSLTWNACTADPGSAHDVAFACNDNSATHELHVAFSLATPVDSVVGAEIVIDLQSATPTLPNWWNLATGGCRGGALSGSLAFGASACVDPWNGLGAASFPSYTIGMPRGGLNQARIKVGVGVIASDARSLATGTLYEAVRLVLASTRSDSCSGCDQPVCLVLNSILLKRLPGAPGGDFFVSTPAPGAGNWATWQGTGADCQAVPVRRNLTWGAVKSLYR